MAARQVGASNWPGTARWGVGLCGGCGVLTGRGGVTPLRASEQADLVSRRAFHKRDVCASHSRVRGPPGSWPWLPAPLLPERGDSRHSASCSARKASHGFATARLRFRPGMGSPTAARASSRRSARWCSGKRPRICECRTWHSRRKHRADIWPKSGGLPPRSCRRFRACRHLGSGTDHEMPKETITATMPRRAASNAGQPPPAPTTPEANCADPPLS